MSSPPSSRFSEKQGQYRAFIYMYTLVNGQPPAEADMQRFFEVTPTSVHRMIMELEARGLIRTQGRRRRTLPRCEPSLDRGPGPRSATWAG
jgi:Mn-dependent DtxR family transcriptional regulator